MLLMSNNMLHFRRYITFKSKIMTSSSRRFRHVPKVTGRRTQNDPADLLCFLRSILTVP